MKIKTVSILMLIALYIGCVVRHTATFQVENHLYLEYYNVNPAGVEEVYLTDSAYFRVLVGKYDTEHEKIGCKIEGDTITVFKTKAGENRTRIVEDTAKLSKEYLIKNRVHTTKPLFDFR